MGRHAHTCVRALRVSDTLPYMRHPASPCTVGKGFLASPLSPLFFFLSDQSLLHTHLLLPLPFWEVGLRTEATTPHGEETGTKHTLFHKNKSIMAKQNSIAAWHRRFYALDTGEREEGERRRKEGEEKEKEGRKRKEGEAGGNRGRLTGLALFLVHAGLTGH